MTRDDVHEYLRLFNERQYDQFARFYADDVEYIMDAGNDKIFHGPQAIVDLYRELHEYFDEALTIENMALSDSMIAIEMDTWLSAKKAFDLPGFVEIPDGQVCHMMCFNHYDLNAEGKIARIRVAFQSIEYMPISQAPQQGG